MESATTKQGGPGQGPVTRFRLERIARIRSVDLRTVVLEALEQYLEREEKNAEWSQEGDDALKHFNETGLHLTGAEVDEWLARLEEGDDVDPPPCHI
ncbi:MAG: CopG family transcriptional regulator [Pseudomonadota bacterium]